jgi:hypothetical protein
MILKRKTKEIFMDHLQFVWSFRLFLSLPGRTGSRRRKKGREDPSYAAPACSPQRDAGGKGMAGLKTAEARIGQRGIIAFFGETNARLPGQGSPWPYGKPSIPRTLWKYALLMIHIYFVP